MSPTPLWENRRWRIVLPEQPLTASHLAIIDRDPARLVDTAAAAALIDAYRRSRSGLWHAAGSRGFMVSFAVAWEPDADAIGEPDPIDGAPRVIHLFGRSPDDPTSPVRAMAVPRQERRHATVDASRLADLTAALAAGAPVEMSGPTDRDCDGCRADVLPTQERWRSDGVRVIRPRSVMIDAQAILLPLRHVASLGDLADDEVTSMLARLVEVVEQFSMASGITGLSCFANDGSAARQETPHVHLHVFGRSHRETANPFELLARPPSTPTHRSR